MSRVENLKESEPGDLVEMAGVLASEEELAAQLNPARVGVRARLAGLHVAPPAPEAQAKSGVYRSRDAA
ncbi:MAG: hypothetical protein HY817_00910 [Candidatus Abawacabacteria bacterium]|nr:hypothetical protein [Candidatus Abawacabacteria bacterium]